MLAPKTPFAASLGSGATIVPNIQSSNMAPTRRAPALPTPSTNLASPTQSEFSDGDSPDAVKNWDVDQVCDYLRTVKCGEYEKIFRKNHINGENLLEMDKEVLKEMGIEKVGDRVRLFLGIKKLRTRAYANQKKRNRVFRFSFILYSFNVECSSGMYMLTCVIRTPSADLISNMCPRPAVRPAQDVVSHPTPLLPAVSNTSQGHTNPLESWMTLGQAHPFLRQICDGNGSATGHQDSPARLSSHSRHVW